MAHLHNSRSVIYGKGKCRLSSSCALHKEAAEAVCSEGVEQAKILELMARLVDKSLVIMEPK